MNKMLPCGDLLPKDNSDAKNNHGVLHRKSAVE